MHICTFRIKAHSWNVTWAWSSRPEVGDDQRCETWLWMLWLPVTAGLYCKCLDFHQLWWRLADICPFLDDRMRISCLLIGSSLLLFLLVLNLEQAAALKEHQWRLYVAGTIIKTKNCYQVIDAEFFIFWKYPLKVRDACIYVCVCVCACSSLRRLVQ